MQSPINAVEVPWDLSKKKKKLLKLDKGDLQDLYKSLDLFKGIILYKPNLI